MWEMREEEGSDVSQFEFLPALLNFEPFIFFGILHI